MLQIINGPKHTRCAAHTPLSLPSPVPPYPVMRSYAEKSAHRPSVAACTHRFIAPAPCSSPGRGGRVRKGQRGAVVRLHGGDGRHHGAAGAPAGTAAAAAGFPAPGKTGFKPPKYL